MEFLCKRTLQHHGILGMHWGIRRYQNPDGSLTEEGRARYSSLGDRIDLAAEGANAHSRGKYGGDDRFSKSLAVDDVSRELSLIDKNYKDTLFNEEELAAINDSMNKINDHAAQMDNLASKERKKILEDPAFKDQIDKKLFEEFGNGCDDEEYFTLVRNEIVYDEMTSRMDSDSSFMRKMQEQQTGINKEYDRLVDKSKDITARIIDEIGDADLQVVDQKVKRSDVVDRIVGMRTTWYASGVARNVFEDAMYNYDPNDYALGYYSMDDYNKRHGN